MSKTFSDTSNNNGIIQGIEVAIYGQNGLTRITGNTTELQLWTARINNALDRAFSIIFQADGRWQFDDSNHDDYPTITTNLVASQRDYPFITDENSNLILEVHKVYAKKDDTSQFDLLESVNELNEYNFFDGDEVEGNPYRYGKKANAIFLDPVPETNVTDGLKVEISREGSYFTTGDTSKKAGFAGLFHDYLVMRPAFEYALENNLSNVQGLQLRSQELEDGILKYYSKRAQDERQILKPKPISYI